MICHWNRQLKPYWFPLRKNRVNWGHNSPPLSAIGLRDVNLVVDLVLSQSVSQSDFVSQSVSQSVRLSQSVSQSDFVSQSVSQT